MNLIKQEITGFFLKLNVNFKNLNQVLNQDSKLNYKEAIIVQLLFIQ